MQYSIEIKTLGIMYNKRETNYEYTYNKGIRFLTDRSYLIFTTNIVTVISCIQY